MFDTFNGLPIHPLVVHGVVVLLPLAILGTIRSPYAPRGARSTARSWSPSPSSRRR